MEARQEVPKWDGHRMFFFVVLMGGSLVPSGELTFCHGKSQFFMGKSTINDHFQLLC